MNVKFILFVFVSITLMCCVSTPTTTSSTTDVEVKDTTATNVTVSKPSKTEEIGKISSSDDKTFVSFDPSTISREQYEEEKSEIQLLVEQLNKITSARDYVGWLNFISDEYKNYYSDPEVLKAQTSRLPVKNLKLNNLQDYFKYVFVVSRQKCRVDDINYITPTRVKVLQREPGKVLIIYNLEKFEGHWKIVLETN